MLPNQLVKAVFVYRAVAIRIRIHPMICTGGFAVDGNAEADWRSGFGWPKNQMKIASMKAVNDGAGRSERGSNLTLVLPLAGKRPLIQFEIGRCFVDLRLVLIEPARGGEVFSPVIADVGLGRLDVTGVGCGFSAGRGDLCGTGRERLVIRLFEEAANPVLRFLIAAFAKVVVTNLSGGVDEVVRGPVFIVKAAPDAIVVIHRDRISDAEIANGFADVRLVFLEGKLWSVHADNDEAAVLVLFVPGLDVGQRPQTIDAGVRIPPMYARKSKSMMLANSFYNANNIRMNKSSGIC
jgi:hypothetical protein